MPSSPVILYRYDASPFSHKVDNALLLKRVPHHRVNVAPLLPRPEISDILGINYRRIPLLAIGNDVYCDTSLIVSALERRFPPQEGFGTLFPFRKHARSADTGLIKAFSKFYADSALFTPASLLLPWDKLPSQIVKDRSDLRGAPLNVTALAANRDKTLGQMSTHLILIEEQLSDGREWLFATELPGLADVSVHFILAWVKGFKAAKPVFNDPKFPHVYQWLDRFTAYLQRIQKEQQAPIVVKADVAGDLILSSSHESDSVVGFDAIESERLGIKLGDIVRVTPEDTGRNYPATGKLVALSIEEVVLEGQAQEGTVRCHFPRLGYRVVPVTNSKL